MFTNAVKLPSKQLETDVVKTLLVYNAILQVMSGLAGIKRSAYLGIRTPSNSVISPI